MKTGAVVAAARRRSSLSTFSPMLPVGDSTVIRRIIITLKRSGVGPVVVVTGRNGGEVERHIAGLRVICLHNKEYDHAQICNSVCMGLGYIKDLCGRVSILPARFPLFLPQTARRILESDATVVCPMSEGRRGYPVLVSSNIIRELLSYKGDRGLRGATRQVNMDNRAEGIAVEDQGVIFSVEADEGCLQGDLKNEQLDIYLQVQLTLERDEGFPGSSMARFPSLIDHTGSMQTARRQMHMSHTKGWKTLKAAERELGYPLLITQSGGAEEGSLQLTSKAKNFLDRFLKMEKELMEDAQRLYQRYFYVEDEAEK